MGDDIYCGKLTDDCFIGGTIKHFDCLFAAHARQDIPALLAEVERLREYEQKCHDCPMVCVKEQYLAALEEREQIQAAYDCLNDFEQTQSAKLLKRVSELEQQVGRLESQRCVANCIERNRRSAAPNEALTCEGCNHKDRHFAICSNCKRVRKQHDYYYRRPEGSE